MGAASFLSTRCTLLLSGSNQNCLQALPNAPVLGAESPLVENQVMKIWHSKRWLHCLIKLWLWHFWWQWEGKFEALSQRPAKWMDVSLLPATWNISNTHMLPVLDTIASRSHGDFHSSLSNFIWDTKGPDSPCFLIEIWKTSQNYFYTKVTWNGKLGSISRFHPSWHRIKLGLGKRCA